MQGNAFIRKHEIMLPADSRMHVIAYSWIMLFFKI